MQLNNSFLSLAENLYLYVWLQGLQNLYHEGSGRAVRINNYNCKESHLAEVAVWTFRTNSLTLQFSTIPHCYCMVVVGEIFKTL